MTKYINTEECEKYFYEHLSDAGMAGAMNAIDEMPAADVKPVVYAYWISVPHKRARVCSRCECDEPYKFADEYADVYNFCPHCGAHMKNVSHCGYDKQMRGETE